MSANVPMFNYASLTPAGEYLPELRIDEGKSALVNFLQDIPGMENPPFVFCKVHWISEMGDKGRLIQCFGGQCCEQITWQKGWNGQPGKFEATKPKQRYFIPVVHYEADPANPAQARASIKYLNMTWTAYNALVTTMNNTTEGLSFFDRDITLTARKVNGATDYLYDKKETQAQWKSNPVFKAQVEEQLPSVPMRLKTSMPQFITADEFATLKPQLDAKVQAAMKQHQLVNQPGAQAGFNGLPGQAPQMPGMPASQLGQMPVQPQQFTQPQVNIPLNVQGTPVASAPAPTQSIPSVPSIPQVDMTIQGTPVPGVMPQVPTQAPVETVVQESAPATSVIPEASLEFDPSQLLK